MKKASGRGTLAILALLLAVFAAEGARGAVGDELALLAMGGLPGDGRLNGEYWRLIAYSALHLNSVHLLLNGALLWWVGNVVERRVGALWFGVAYLASVVAAGLAITLVRLGHPRPGSSVGASGGIFGLVACALVLLYRRDAAHFGQGGRVRLGSWIVVLIGFGASLLPGVSLSGHAGGFVAGLIAGALLPVAPRPEAIPES